jgi:hypothetical protein
MQLVQQEFDVGRNVVRDEYDLRAGVASVGHGQGETLRPKLRTKPRSLMSADVRIAR